MAAKKTGDTFIKDMEIQEEPLAKIDLEHIMAPPIRMYPKSDVVSYVASGMLFAFPSNLPDEFRNDILNSMLLAQLAADRPFDRNSQLEDWMTFFSSTLGHLHWTFDNTDITEMNIQEREFTMADLALRTMRDSGTSMERHVSTFREAYGRINRHRPGAATEILYSCTYHILSKDTTMIFCSFDELLPPNGLSVNMMLFSLRGIQEPTSPPLFNVYHTRKLLPTKTMSTRITFDCKSYGSIRKHVLGKLGRNIKVYIHEVV